MSRCTLVLIVCVVAAMATLAASSKNPTICAKALKKVFDGAKPYADLSNAFYSVKGLELLGETAPADLCKLVKSKVDKNSVESIYYATSLAAKLADCALPVADFQAALTTAASSKSVADLYYYAFVSSAQKLPLDSAKLSKSVFDALKADSSIINQAYSFHIATLLAEEEAKKFYEGVEEILEQADEVDKTILQYEGGVGTTSLVLEGIFALSESLKQFPASLDEARLAKFIQYLTNKRQPTNIKSAYFLLRAVLKLSDNPFHVAIVVNRVSPVSLSAGQPNLIVSLTNLLGRAVNQAGLSLQAESTLLTEKKSFTAKSSDASVFELKLFDNQKAASNVVKLALAQPEASTKYFLLQKQVEVKVAATVSLADVQLGAADRDQTAPALKKFETKALLLDVDQQSKLYVKFSLASKSGDVKAQQTFVSLTETKSGRQIVFLAESAGKNQYSAEIDFTTNAKNFNFESATYAVELIVSDKLIETPIRTNVANVRVKFAEDASTNKLLNKNRAFLPLPEIKHTFRVPDSTPPFIVSLVFTVLSLAPLGLLVVLWLSIGVNFSKFTVSLSGLVFHVALAAIFGLFYCYWTKLNMFVTVRYLALLGGIAIFAGNHLLRQLASLKEKKE